MSPRTNRVGVMDARTARLLVAFKPLYYTFIAFGVVPVTLRGWPRAELSFHPLRSTLLWALLLYVGVLPSVWRVWTVSFAVLVEGESNPIASYGRFPALLAISHTANLALLVPIWCEAHRYKKVFGLAKTLVSCLDDDVLSAASGWPRRRTVVVAWLWVVGLVVVSPGVVGVWQFKLTEFGGEAVRVPAHCMANVLIVAVVSSLSLAYYIVRDVAHALAHRFAQESSREMSCAELLRYRRAWLTLRDALQAVLFAPHTVTLACALLAINSVLCIYHVLNGILDGVPLEQTLGLIVSSSQIGFLLVIMCSAADGAVDAVAHLAKSFELVEPLTVTNYPFAREVFREALSHNPVSVCVGGFWYLNRRTVLSVGLMILTYLVVLVEFRQQPGASCGLCSSSSNATRDA